MKKKMYMSAFDLRYILITKKNKTLCSLLASSNMSHGHIVRSHYVILIWSNLISTPDSSLNPVEFGWNSVDSVLMPNKYIFTLPEMHIVTCGCKKNCTGRCQCSKLGSSCTEFCKCIKSSKYVHFWTLALKTILILIKFPYQQRHISCRIWILTPHMKMGTMVILRHFEYRGFWG